MSNINYIETHKNLMKKVFNAKQKKIINFVFWVIFYFFAFLMENKLNEFLMS